MGKRNPTSVPRIVRRLHLRPFYRTERRSKGIITWYSTLVRPLELVYCHPDRPIVTRRLRVWQITCMSGRQGGGVEALRVCDKWEGSGVEPSRMERQIQFGGGIPDSFMLDPTHLRLLQNALNLKTHAATEALALGRRL